MHPEIDRIPALEAWLKAPHPGVVFQALDLLEYEAQFCALGKELTHAVFIGCRFSRELGAHLAAQQCSIIPELAGRAFTIFRGHLYSPEELFAAFEPDQPDSYLHTPDAMIYASYMEGPGKMHACGLDEVLARRLHDFSVTDALDDFLEEQQFSGVVAVMGGHDTPRGHESYRGVATLARTLTLSGRLVISGGGPGIMEAANLGAYFAHEPEDVLRQAIDELSAAPSYKDPRWLSVAWRVRRRAGKPGRSVGVPTWFYGHEPPNAFATDIAKYFENSVREEGLLAIAKDGVVFAAGNAGTVQEIFQDACQNYYKTYYERASPMVMFGKSYWTQVKQVEPLLRTLAAEKDFEHLLLFSDDVDEIAAFLSR
ncbi:MAG TPA: hypothetical protein VGF69_14345 [Thermoanaerobaculia bacterium]|jgi:predicted Rossmann-fold nucleotide-binding protein